MLQIQITHSDGTTETWQCDYDEPETLAGMWLPRWLRQISYDEYRLDKSKALHVWSENREVRPMSTRCQIAFYETEDQPTNKPSALIYRHSDGYPEGVMPTLTEWAKDFHEHRGLSDASYAAARCIQHMMNEQDKELENMWEELGRPNEKNYTGFGICGDHDLNGDIEYFYRVDPSGISYWEMSFDADYLDADFNPTTKPTKHVKLD